MKKIKIYAETTKLRSRMEHVIEMEVEEWEEMDDEDKRELVRDELINNGFDWGWEEL